MRVQRVRSSAGTESWTVIDRGRLVDPIDAFLAHLTAIERSPNTVRAYAHDLRDWFEYLGQRDRDWTTIGVEDVGRFAEWLRLPIADVQVARLPHAPEQRTGTTVNRKLSTVTSFYVFHERRGVDVAAKLTAWRTQHGGSHKPLLAHLGPRAQRTRSALLRLRVDHAAPRTLTPTEIGAVLAHCHRLRDTLMFATLRDTGMRSGEALGLRHDDIDVAGRQIRIARRDNANGARAKSIRERIVPAPAALFRTYTDYLHVEYGSLDSDYVFVVLSGRSRGTPWTYDAFHSLVERISRDSAVRFRPHMFRHTYATELLNRGVAAEIVQMLLGHASFATTVDTYSHLKVQDARRALQRAGWLDSPIEVAAT